MNKTVSMGLRMANKFFAIATSAVAWFFLIAIAAALMIACGIYMLIGMAWSLIFGGLFLFGLSALIRRGIANSA